MADAKQIGAIFLTILAISIVAILSLKVFAQVNKSTTDNLDHTLTEVANESVTARLDTYVALTYDNEIVCLEARNSTDHIMVLDGNYTCDNNGFKLTQVDWDNATIRVTYDYGADTTFHTHMKTASSSFTSAMDIAIIGLIVLAAVFIISIVLMLTRR